MARSGRPVLIGSPKDILMSEFGYNENGVAAAASARYQPQVTPDASQSAKRWR